MDRKKFFASRKDTKAKLEENPDDEDIKNLNNLEKELSNLLIEYSHCLEQVESLTEDVKKLEKISETKAFGTSILNVLENNKYYLITIICVIDSFKKEHNDIAFKYDRGVKLLASEDRWPERNLKDDLVEKTYRETRKHHKSKNNYFTYEVKEINPKDFKPLNWKYVSPEYLSMVKG
jgi:hypothetical protein